MIPKCIIFDCDGTLVDSEDVTNRIIAEMAGELGIAMTGAEATASFCGKTIEDVLYKMRELSGKEVPEGWLERLIKNVSLAWKKELVPVEGAQDLLESLSIPFCVASNGNPSHVRESLKLTGLYDFFKERIFTASDVGIPKPAPDLFLYAAKKMGFEPNDCVVVEDSITGVTAAVRANMKVYGLINQQNTVPIYSAAGKFSNNSAEELQNAGAIPISSLKDLMMTD